MGAKRVSPQSITINSNDPALKIKQTGSGTALSVEGRISADGGITSPMGQLDPAVQFGAAGSVLANLPTRVSPAENLLKTAVWWIDAAHPSASSQAITNLGWGGSTLNAQAGSGSGVDSNDPKYLSWEGENYVYLPGVAGNLMTVPDEASLDITGDIDLRVNLAMDDWTPASSSALLDQDSCMTQAQERGEFVSRLESPQPVSIWVLKWRRLLALTVLFGTIYHGLGRLVTRFDLVAPMRRHNDYR